MREKEREYDEMVQREVKEAEVRLRLRLEKMWIEKLKNTEDSASNDVSTVIGSHCYIGLEIGYLQNIIIHNSHPIDFGFSVCILYR